MIQPYYQDDLVAIYHGDAREVLPQLELEADVLWTDPPYGVDYVGKTKAGFTTPGSLTISGDGGSGLTEYLQTCFQAVDPALKPGARFYIACPAGPNGTAFRLAIAHVGWKLHQVLVWVKHAIVLGHSDYHYQHEDVLYGWKPGEGRVGRGNHEGSCWYGGNAQSSVFSVDRPMASREHPTQKPTALVSRQLTNSARPGDLVLDPFLGSGTTLRVAKNLGLRAVGIEIEEQYCAASARRLAQETLFEDISVPAASNGHEALSLEYDDIPF